MRALVTGAAAGLGQQLVKQLAASGWDVTAIDRSEMPATQNVAARRVDLADRSDVDRLVIELAGEEPFDWIIHNAGVSATGKFERIPESAYRRLLTLNCETPLVMTNGLLRSESVNPGGRVVFISSLSHYTGYPGGAVYGASKDVLTIYARSIRRDLKPLKIAAVTVFPGPIRTEHAARHAPPNAAAERRMEPAVLAAKIIRATRAGKSSVFPGMPAKGGRLFGLFLPTRATDFMRRVIFEKLDREVY